ncbi:MAG TPA: hypothetical protein QGF35_02725 [Dehalococcoidia bacterium]|nr:hypothetical protein [Dehalococcoidia bacterium]
MHIDHSLLADYAEIVGGKLYLMGGGWSGLTVPKVPSSARLAVAVGIRVDWDETNRPIPVEISIEDDDGEELVRITGQVNVGRPPDLTPGYSQLAQLAANMAFTIRAVGGYRAKIKAGDGDRVNERLLPFRVRQSAGSTPGSG